MILRLRLALPLAISLLFVAGSFIAPNIASAQTQQDCESNSPPQVCFSYDPTVNPLLKSAGASYRDPAETTPRTDPDRGECVTYNVATGVGTGCMKGGVFTVYSPNPGVEGISFITIQTGGPADVYSPDPVAQAIEGTVSAFVSCTFNGPVDCLITGLGNSILALSNLLLGMAGIFLNLVIVKTVFGFSTFIGNSPGLLIAWGILRDLGNMLLLFGFIFIGIATILDLQTYSAKKALPRLLIFAVLMNFSLFAAEAIIDVSNVMSAALYAQGNSDPCFGQSGETIEVTASADPEADREACLLNVGLAGAMMEASGLSTMFQIKDDQGITDIVTFIGLSLFAVIGAVVFFAAGIMLLTRALVLTFLMITAPIGFAAMALPPMQKFGEEWWNKLIHQAFFAPILILLILVSLKVSESFAGGKENSLAGALTQPNSSAMGVILVFAIVIGLLIASLMAAKKFGAMGADMAIKGSSKLAGRLSFGAGAFVGRQTLGRASSASASKIRSSRYATTWYGKGLAKVADKGAKASYDVRATKPFQNAQKQAGMDFGKAPKDGYKGTVDRIKKDKVEYAKTLSGGTLSRKDYKARLEDLSNKSASATAAVGKQQSTVDATKQELEDSKKQRELSEQGLSLAKKAAARKPDDLRLQDRVAQQERILESNRAEEAAAQVQMDKESEKLNELLKKQAEAVKEEETTRNNRRVQVDKKTQQENYANKLQSDWQTQQPFRVFRGATGKAYEEAADAIRKNKNKTKLEEALDTIKSETEKKADKEEGEKSK